MPARTTVRNDGAPTIAAPTPPVEAAVVVDGADVGGGSVAVEEVAVVAAPTAPTAAVGVAPTPVAVAPTAPNEGGEAAWA